jgi:hypothetical protein
MIRRAKFHHPNPSTRNQVVRMAVVEPNGGLNVSKPAIALQMNESPAMSNYDVVDGQLQMRSGLSMYGVYSSSLSGDPMVALYNTRVRTGVNATPRSIFAFSETTVLTKMAVPNAAWNKSSGPVLAGLDVSQEHNFYSITQAQDSFGSVVVFFSQGPGQHVMYHYVPESGAGSYSSLTNFMNSGYSGGHLLQSFDDRLVIFKVTESAGTLRYQRAVWSAKGDPFNYTRGGFQDIVAMQGEATGIAAQENRLLLFTTADVWQATPRGDHACRHHLARSRTAALLAAR